MTPREARFHVFPSWSSGRAPSRRQGRNIRGALNSFACMHCRLDPIPCGRAPVAILLIACLPRRKNHAQNKQNILSEILVVPCFVFLRFWVLEKAESIGRKHTFTMLAVSFLHCYPPLSTFPSKGKGGTNEHILNNFRPVCAYAYFIQCRIISARQRRAAPRGNTLIVFKVA